MGLQKTLKIIMEKKLNYFFTKFDNNQYLNCFYLSFIESISYYRIIFLRTSLTKILYSDADTYI